MCTSTSGRALETLDNAGEAPLDAVTPGIATPVPPLVGGEADDEIAIDDESSFILIVTTVRQEPTADNLRIGGNVSN